MIPKECKRLAEVDFPIAVVSKHAVRENSVRRGHPKTLHLWWARRPLAACRALLLGLLWPDPCDPHCPEDFKQEARELLVAPIVTGKVGSSDFELRQALLKFIGDFSNWDLANDRTYLTAARRLVTAAQGENTLVVDPFSGGGSIPLEALRLGCDVYASDLNPVACLILKVMLEDLPRAGASLADGFSAVASNLTKAVERLLAAYFPSDADGSEPTAYIWARTVSCETPKCGIEFPLVRSFWLAKKSSRKIGLRYSVLRAHGDVPDLQFEIFSPKDDNAIPKGTVNNGRATCPACSITLANERVKAQLNAKRGGANEAKLLAVVLQQKGARGRRYRLPVENDFAALEKAGTALTSLSQELGFSADLDEPLCPIRPSPNARGVSAPPDTESYISPISSPLGNDCPCSLLQSSSEM